MNNKNDWIRHHIQKSTKSKIIKIGRILSKEYFRLYLKNKNLDITDEDIKIMGFKEIDNEYIMLLYFSGLPNHYCEMVFDKRNHKNLKTNMYKKLMYHGEI